jgi:hypothetical protein
MGFFSRFFGQPTRDDFAEDVIKELRKIAPDVRVRYNKEEYELQIEGSENSVPLSSGFDEFSRAGTVAKRAILARVARLVLNPPKAC